MRWVGVASFIVKSVLMTQPNHHSFEHVNVLKKPSLNCIDTLCAPLKVCCAGPATGGPCCGGIKLRGCGMSEGDDYLSKCDNVFG